MLLPGVVPFPLRLSCDGVHDGVLRVHADGRVVLGVDDGGLATGARHLYGLMGGEGVVQSAGVEAGAVGGECDVVEEEEEEEDGCGDREERQGRPSGDMERADRWRKEGKYVRAGNFKMGDGFVLQRRGQSRSQQTTVYRLHTSFPCNHKL